MTTHPARFQGRFYRDPTSPRSHSPDGVYAQPKSKTPPSRKVWPRFEEVVPYAEPRHGRGPEGGGSFELRGWALGGKGNARCSRLQRTNHPEVPKQTRGMAHRWRCCEERIPGECVNERLSRKRVHASISRTGGALSALEKGESTPNAAALIRQQAHEIDDLWDRCSVAPTRSFAVSLQRK